MRHRELILGRQVGIAPGADAADDIGDIGEAVLDEEVLRDLATVAGAAKGGDRAILGDLGEAGGELGQGDQGRALDMPVLRVFFGGADVEDKDVGLGIDAVVEFGDAHVHGECSFKRLCSWGG
jgi:hypothetical protein